MEQEGLKEDGSKKEYDYKNIVLNPSVPKVYANGYSIGHTPADTYIIFLLHGVPQVGINMSVPALKALGEMIGSLVKIYEDKFDTEVESMVELSDKAKNNKK